MGERGAVSLRAEHTSASTTSDDLSVCASGAAVSVPDSQQETGVYFLMDTEGCLISQVRDKRREELGGIGEKG